MKPQGTHAHEYWWKLQPEAMDTSRTPREQKKSCGYLPFFSTGLSSLWTLNVHLSSVSPESVPTITSTKRCSSLSNSQPEVDLSARVAKGRTSLGKGVVGVYGPGPNLRRERYSQSETFSRAVDRFRGSDVGKGGDAQRFLVDGWVGGWVGLEM